MDNLQFEKIGFEDLETLQKLSVKTFSETFSSSNSAENLALYIEEKMSLHNLENEFKNEDSEYYFAKFNDEVVGYLKLNFKSAQTEKFDEYATEIHRIYVLKAFQRRSVGDFLLKNAIKIAKKRNSNFMWLGVWEKNYNAIGFYEKQGFRTFEKHNFKLGNDSQTDLIMKLVLN